MMESLNTLISIGCHVDLNLLDREGKKNGLGVDIVLDESADFQQGFLGASTPLAKILLGEKAGTVIPYLKDDIYAIEILHVSPSKVSPDGKAEEKRQSNLKRTLQQVEHINAVVFASSFTGKWGDYDPDSLPTEEKPAEDEAVE